MKVDEFLEVLSHSNLLRIRQEGRDLYRGYLGLLRQDDSGAYEKFRDAEIKCFMIEPEITHRDWKRKRLEPPLLPEEAAQYSFRDLQVTLYYKIEI